MDKSRTTALHYTVFASNVTTAAGSTHHPGAPDSSKPGRGKNLGGKPRMSYTTTGTGAAS
jgi:hypothetical protein